MDHKDKETLLKDSLNSIKTKVEKDAWIALSQYFDGKANGSEAKVAGVIITTIAREAQAKNNARHLNLAEKRYEQLEQDNGRLLLEGAKEVL